MLASKRTRGGRRLTTAWLLLSVIAALCWLHIALSNEQTTLASSNPLSGQPDAIAAGQELYAKNCTLCHGRKANGKTGRWQSKDLRVFNKGYSRFVKIVKKGIKPKPRSNNQMQAWEKFLSDEQIAQIGAYLETLAIRGANWKDSE